MEQHKGNPARAARIAENWRSLIDSHTEAQELVKSRPPLKIVKREEI
jgi:hypothetical protein